jgi:ABC-type phosphate/phosphonate transport system ATPase subunit
LGHQQPEEAMKNVEMKVEHGTLIVTVDLTTELGPSASGKSVLLASTEGNVDVPGAPAVKIGLNVYRKKKRFT